MSVLYRALWTDDSQPDLGAYIAEVRRRFSVWATESAEPVSLENGATTLDLRMNRTRAIAVRSLDGAELHGKPLIGLEGVTVDSATDRRDDTAWTTVMRVVADGTAAHVWVENRVETNDLSLHVSVGRPRLVDELLALPGNPYIGGSSLPVEPISVSAEEVPVLVEILRSSTRRLPVIVCSEPGEPGDGRWLTRADRIGRRAGGIATVITLDSAAVAAFRAALGDLAVWGGGARVYTPVPVEDPSEGWRHRYTPGPLLASREEAMIDRIVYAVAQMSARRRVPDEFSAFTTTAPATSSPIPLTGFLSEAEAEAEREQWQEALDEQVAATNDAQRELGQKVAHLDRIKSALEAEGLHHVFYGTQHEEQSAVPDVVQNTSEAILAAQMYLTDWLEIHDEAGRELDGIDTGPNAFAWGNTAWRGFRALASFAQARSDGFQFGFFDWCKSGPPQGWPATSKKLSMTESDTVQQSKTLSRARILPISTDVDPNGRVTMWSHLKIAEGGGDLAPRVYFYDDTNGETKKMHVGFVGPHYMMPNTKS